MPDGFTHPDPRSSLLLDARDCLERAERHERWGASAQGYCWQAAEYLRLAGRPDLADDCSDEFGVDVAGVLQELDKEAGL